MATVVSKQEEMLLDMTSKVYKVVVEHGGDGVLQSELWKELTLTSRDGSRLAIRLERRGMIRREKILDGGRWTYKLRPLRMPVHIESIEQAPCITCPYESKCSLTGVVSPLSCPWLVEWVTKEYREINKPMIAPVQKRVIPAKIVKHAVAASRVK
ncbi:MAG: helix-turn-helix transcriptional regulator [Nitrososphaerales archaeon]